MPFKRSARTNQRTILLFFSCIKDTTFTSNTVSYVYILLSQLKCSRLFEVTNKWPV